MIRLLLSVTCCLAITACTGEPVLTGSQQPDNGTTGAGTGTGMDDDAHGERKPLGSLTVAGHTFEVIQLGDMTAGKDGAIDLEWPAGKERPETVRAWIGIESGEGSMRMRLAKEGDRIVHGHVKVPAPVPAGSKLWIEITDGDAKGQAAIAYR